MSSVLNWLIFSKLVAFKKTALTCLQTVGPPQRNTLRCLYQKQTFIKKIYCIVFIKKTQAKHMALSLSKSTTRKHMALFITFSLDQIKHTKYAKPKHFDFESQSLEPSKQGRSVRLKFPGSCSRQTCCYFTKSTFFRYPPYFLIFFYNLFVLLPLYLYNYILYLFKSLS